ncbi:MAG: DUF1841 family protein [Betaproteobacteria bacterium]
MFDPSQQDVRKFFCATYRKSVARAPLTAIETIASDWIARHPEYHDLLADEAGATQSRFDAADGRGNPFLHLSMHLAIAEQLSIDQPPGIRAAWQQLAATSGDEHAASHEVMECLGEVLWQSQRSGMPPDGDAYIECLRRRSGTR